MSRESDVHRGKFLVRDDYHSTPDQTKNLTRTCSSATKHPEPVLRCEVTWNRPEDWFNTQCVVCDEAEKLFKNRHCQVTLIKDQCWEGALDGIVNQLDNGSRKWPSHRIPARAYFQ